MNFKREETTVQRKQKSNPAVSIWEIVYPLGIYYVVIILAMYIAQWIFGSGESRYMICQIFTSIIALPVMYSFFKTDQKRFSRRTIRECAQESLDMLQQVLVIIVIAALLGTALNNLISMSPLVSMSKGYAEANRNFYGSTLLPELLGSVVFTPILEELLCRGIIYGRLREMTVKPAAILISSLLFGIMHFNLVQFVYAFLLGIVLALLMERAGHVYGAIVAHMTANFLAVVRTETGILAGTVDGSLCAWLISTGCLLAGVVFLFFALRVSGKSG